MRKTEALKIKCLSQGNAPNNDKARTQNSGLSDSKICILSTTRTLYNIKMNH